MDPVPYAIRPEDVDEVLSAYGASDDEREAARSYVMRHVLDLDEIVSTAPETPHNRGWLHRDELAPISNQPGDQSPDRREMAMAAIEDLLLREGFLELDVDEPRLFPISTRRDSERDDA